MTIHYGEFYSGVKTDLIRELETGSDIRITEGGDTRITGTVSVGGGSSLLSATGTKTGFIGQMYVNVSGAWKDSEPYVKHEGSWKHPTEIYKKVGINWVRVY